MATEKKLSEMNGEEFQSYIKDLKKEYFDNTQFKKYKTFFKDGRVYEEKIER